MSFRAAYLRSRSLNIVSLSDMIEGSYRSWDLYTTGQLVDGLQQKKKKKEKKRRKPVFIKRKWSHVVFSRATISSFHSVYFNIYDNILYKEIHKSFPIRKVNVTQYNSTDAHSYKVVIYIQKLHHFFNHILPWWWPKVGQKVLEK